LRNRLNLVLCRKRQSPTCKLQPNPGRSQKWNPSGRTGTPVAFEGKVVTGGKHSEVEDDLTMK